MQMISEVMTHDVRFLSPQESLQRAAQMMDELNVGAIPVCEEGRLLGMLTDRDIAIHAAAAGKMPDAHIEEAMSGDVRWCFEDQLLDDVMQQMKDVQIRRVPVVSHDDAHRLIGIVSLGDIATRASMGTNWQDAERMVENVSSPSDPDRSRASDSSAIAGKGGGVLRDSAGVGSSGDDLSKPSGTREISMGIPNVNYSGGGATTTPRARSAAGAASCGASRRKS